MDDDTLAVIERDKLNGPDAKVKAVYAVQVPAKDPKPGTVGTLTKTLVRDLVPDLRATNGWTQEKLEGLTIGRDGRVYAVTDNDGLDDATGETVLLRLGDASKVFKAQLGHGPGKPDTKPGPKPGKPGKPDPGPCRPGQARPF